MTQLTNCIIALDERTTNRALKKSQAANKTTLWEISIMQLAFWLRCRRLAESGILMIHGDAVMCSHRLHRCRCDQEVATFVILIPHIFLSLFAHHSSPSINIVIVAINCGLSRRSRKHSRRRLGRRN